jgi:ribonuclease P protein component
MTAPVAQTERAEMTTPRAARPAKLETLKTRSDFARVRGGSRWSGRAFLIEAKRRSDAEPSPGARIGFTITKKIGGAVERNRIRRRLKAAMRDVLSEHPETAGYDYVLVARRPALTDLYADILAECHAAIAALHKQRSKTARQ